jgi:hypothetical protein
MIVKALAPEKFERVHSLYMGRRRCLDKWSRDRWVSQLRVGGFSRQQRTCTPDGVTLVLLGGLFCPVQRRG